MPLPPRHLKFAEPVTIHVTVQGVEESRTITRGEAICDAIRRGGTHAGAAAAYGVTVAEMKHALHDGREDVESEQDSPLARFALAVAEADGQSELFHVGVLRWVATQRENLKAAAWAAAWFLSHRFPDRWGTLTAIDVTSRGEKVGVIGLIEAAREKERRERDVIDVTPGGGNGAGKRLSAH